MAGTDAIDEAVFLVRSPHRVGVLRTLRTGPSTRGELTESTGVSRVTLGRSLGELEGRNWVARADGRYHLTPLGAFVLSATEGFLDAMDTQRRLGEVVDLLPMEELGFDLRRLRDAEIVLATRHDTGETIRRYLSLIETATEMRVLKDTVDVAVTRAISDRIDAGKLTASVVYSPEAVETTKKIPEAREAMLRDLGNGKEAFVYPGRLTHHLAIVDETVALFLLDDRGVQGLIETSDEVVRQWATELFEQVSGDADRLSASEFRTGC